MKFARFFAGAALLLAPLPALAQEAPRPDADPALWVVEDEDTKIYLFGTFHLLDGRRDWFNDEVRAAFDASDRLVLEAVIPENPMELQPLIVRYAIDPGGRTLSSQLSAEQNEQLRAALATVGMPPEALDSFEPWFVAMTLASLAAQKVGITGEQGAERILSRAAAERGIEIGELEGIEYQLGMLDGMPREMQIAQLALTLEQFDEIAAQLGPMLAAWSDGNVEQLAAMVTEGVQEHPELYRIIFTERNASWAHWIAERLEQPGTVFLAVGAGHLAGEGSVQDLLRRRGIATARVPAR